MLGLSASAESVAKRPSCRRSSSRRYKNKENGGGTSGVSASVGTSGTVVSGTQGKHRSFQPSLPPSSTSSVTERDCTETDVHTIHVTLTYKPRI